MPIAIDATVGGSSANSFVLLTEAQAYMDGRLNVSAWTGATTDSQNRALVEATRELSAKQWIGQGRVTTTQALSWPRVFAENPDIAWPGLWYYTESEIPQRVKDATCELALQFLIAGTTDIASLDQTLNVRLKKVDVLETEYFDPAMRAQGLDRFPSVTRYIKPLVVGAGLTVPLLRG